MNMIHILIKEFKQNIRNWKANSMMVLFPIILIVILGAAFTNVFNRTLDLENVKVLYTIQESSQIAGGFESYTRELNKQLGIVFDETSDTNKGIKSARDTEYACYIVISDEPLKITIYKNARYNTSANMVESTLKPFAERYSAIMVINKANPAIAHKIMADTIGDYVSTEPINDKKKPGSLDYYAVTMLTLILMYASLTGFWSVKSEYNLKTGNRMLCAPVRKYQVLIGKVLGAILVTIVQALAVLLFSKLIIKADWGSDIFTVLIVVTAESIMAISLGAACGFLIKNEGAATAILNTLIPVFVFLGGGYVPLSEMGAGVTRLSVISPVKWTNDALFRIIYNNDYSIVPASILVSLGAAAVFIAMSAYFSSKEAV